MVKRASKSEDGERRQRKEGFMKRRMMKMMVGWTRTREYEEDMRRNAEM